MHPEPNEISQTDSLDSSVQEQPLPSQHGLLPLDRRTSCQPSAVQTTTQPKSLSTHRSASDRWTDALEDPLQGLRSRGLSSISPGPLASKTAKTSNVSHVSGKRLPERCQRGRHIHDQKDVTTVSIADLPNEVLTHVLSHLPPPALSTVSLVSRRFNQLVTTPHAWRSAFSRFFPGSEALAISFRKPVDAIQDESIYADRRFFTRLTSSASWRSEYILRTKLLRSLARGRPNETPARTFGNQSRGGSGNNALAQVTYTSNLPSPVSHIHSAFGTTGSKNLIRFMHGSADTGMVSMSDPRGAKTDRWGFSDFLGFRQFSDLLPGEEPYGLGPGECIGVPNCMDISQDCGIIYGEGHEVDSILWFRHLEEKRGRALLKSSSLRDTAFGIPQLTGNEAICSVWIAKRRDLFETTDYLIGMLAGSSTGVLTAYSLGTNGARSRRLERGQITARWALCPGVPIIALSVDEQVSRRRLALGRTWVVALNALGELYYLTSMPVQEGEDQAPWTSYAAPQVRESLERRAWATGRSVQWHQVHPSRRVALSTLSEESNINDHYCPQPALRGSLAGSDELSAETKQVERFLQKKPRYFRKMWQGWDMRQQLHVDFAASDGTHRGEIIVVVKCGLDDAEAACVRCFVRNSLGDLTSTTPSSTGQNAKNREIDWRTKVPTTSDSLFGGDPASLVGLQPWTLSTDNSSADPPDGSRETSHEGWRSFRLSLESLRQPRITASAMDSSKHAILPVFEDLGYAMSHSSTSSTPLSSPTPTEEGPEDLKHIPGGGARILAIGTSSGRILLYDLRAALPSMTVMEFSLQPLRIIVTDSPQISCLALNALYLVHGGNDGLVQAWDPLASSTSPIRTLNSRFSSRARRRLIQAEASPAGVGINLFAAGCICLDPDPTILRGMVSLGSHLRFWSYSSNAAEQYKSNKRRLRRTERSSNQGIDRFSGTGRGALRDYIANEKQDLEREKKEKRKENERLAGRFGLDLLGPGASEDEVMAYATMLSEEAAQDDAIRRESAGSSSEATSPLVDSEVYPEQDAVIAEAIQLSLQGQVFAATQSSLPSPPLDVFLSQPASIENPGNEHQLDPDIEYAMQLSLAEYESSASTKKGKEREV